LLLFLRFIFSQIPILVFFLCGGAGFGLFLRFFRCVRDLRFARPAARGRIEVRNGV